MAKPFRSKIVISIVGLLAGYLVAVSAGPAFAFTRQASVTYAKNFACNGDTFGLCDNTLSYKIYAATDCANFVSQALYAGGYPFVYNNVNPLANWWYQASGTVRALDQQSSSWVVAPNLYDQLVASGRVASFIYPAMDAKYSGASGGDVYIYDWGQGEGYSHVAISTNSGAFATFTDSGRSYQSITGGSGDRIAQHTTNRVDSPWNWGYWTTGSQTVRMAMRTKILHLQ